jgi:hypothetical protein
METPDTTAQKGSISMRRHPLYALLLLILGFGTVGIGLYYSELWIVFAGVVPTIFAALVMLNPFVTITDQTLELKNVFGFVRATYDHDGFHKVRIHENTVYIQKGDMQAAVNRIQKKHLHPGDWRIMETTLLTIKAFRSKKA